MYAESTSNATLIMLSQTVLAPLAIMLAALGLWALLARHRFTVTPVWAFALGLAFWVSGSWIRGRLGLPPARAMDVLMLLGVFAAVLEVVLGRVPARWQVPLVVLGAMLLLGWLLEAVLSRMAPGALALNLAGLAVLFLLLYRIPALPGVAPVRDALWLLIAAGAAPVIALDGTLVLGQLAGALAAGCGVIWLAGLVFPNAVKGLALVPPLLLSALLASAHFYAGVDPLALLLVAAGPLVVALLRQLLPKARAWGDNLRTLVLGAVPVALALWVVWPDGSGY